jgi:potassium-transporting ATPase potassium-binding subunit
MTAIGWVEIALFVAVVVALARPLGLYMAAVFEGRRTFLSPMLAPAEGGFYALAGVKPNQEQSWKSYAAALLMFNFLSVVSLFLILRFQDLLPFNPLKFPGLPPELALNTAVSFVTNTNWQSYSGESTMSHFSQMAGLTVHNFLSAATGIAVAIAFARGFARKSASTIGSFWLDLTRATLYILLPISIIFAIYLVWSGIPQTLDASAAATTLEGAKQDIAVGPIASQIAIKMLGTNGGGFFNANAAHPFENPDAISNFLQMVSIFSIGAGLTITFGKMVGNERQGWAILGTMAVLFMIGVGVCYWAETQTTPALAAAHVSPLAGNMEGKEVRFGIPGSALFAVITTAASCGAVNAMHDSFTAIGGMVPLVNIQVGEVIVGGVGAGFYGILLFVILAIFIAGLMVGRTPSFLGKKIEAKEVKFVVLGTVASPLIIMLMTALAASTGWGQAGPLNPGPHGFSEILYAYSSGAGNNGSAFAGITANSPFYCYTLALAMVVGRFMVIIPALAVAGALAAKPATPETSGTFPTRGTLFILLVASVVIIEAALLFFPSLALGPMAEAAANKLF